jgi:serine/threonine-protein kinase
VIDGRADLYALGCVAYYLLTGHLVFDASTAMQMAVAHVASVPVPPSERAGVPIPAGLERLVMACLSKRPENRPANALALLRSLDALQLAATIAPEAAATPASALSATPLFSRPHTRGVLN